MIIEVSFPYHASHKSSSSHLLDELAFALTASLTCIPCPSDTASAHRDRRRIVFKFLSQRLAGSDFPDLPWFFVNLFHRKAERIDRALDDNEAGCRGQDG